MNRLRFFAIGLLLIVPVLAAACAAPAASPATSTVDPLATAPVAPTATTPPVAPAITAPTATVAATATTAPAPTATLAPTATTAPAPTATTVPAPKATLYVFVNPNIVKEIDAETNAVRARDYNFPGIGLQPADVAVIEALRIRRVTARRLLTAAKEARSYLEDVAQSRPRGAHDGILVGRTLTAAITFAEGSS